MSWKFFEALIVVGAFAVALAVWFIPNWAESDTMKKLEAAVNERKELRLRLEAEAAQAEAERERLGLVYFGPGAVPIVEIDDAEAAPAGESAASEAE